MTGIDDLFREYSEPDEFHVQAQLDLFVWLRDKTKRERQRRYRENRKIGISPRDPFAVAMKRALKWHAVVNATNENIRMARSEWREVMRAEHRCTACSRPSGDYRNCEICRADARARMKLSYKPRARSAVYACSRCHDIGHNARTCDVIARAA